MLTSRKRHSTAKPVALLIAAHPIWNVPPFVNAAKELARKGYRVIVTGYQSNDLPHQERLAHGAWIFRIPLTSRRVKWDWLRKFLAVFEFLARSASVARRLQPDVLITFNDPACILQRLTRGRKGLKRVSWLLEYPELERMDLYQRVLFHFSASCWRRAEVIVVPTKERLALHLALRPECAEKTTLVVQNAPLNEPAVAANPSARTQEALAYLKDCAPDTIRIIYSGAIGDRYGADSLIRAAGSFPEGIRLLLLGKKHPLAEEEVGRAIKQTAFPENITWIDEIPYRELPQVLQTCDVGFATYRGDTLNTRFSAPGKLYEYLKCGLLILSDEHCCIYADATAAGCGVFFPKPVDDDGIRAALAELLASRGEIARRKAAARRLFETRLSMEQQIKPLLRLLGVPGRHQSLHQPVGNREPVRA
jgi:glycosyltransferase involved in cell wall biosynthesis